MPSIKKLPECDVLRQHVDERLTNQSIADRYGVTQEAVRQALTRCGIERPRVRNDFRHYLPWRPVRSNHQRHVLAIRLRSYAKKQQGKELMPHEPALLEEFMAYLDGENAWGVPLSVHYDLDDADGFWLEPRRPGDRDYISPPT
jgi:hypothetical protein